MDSFRKRPEYVDDIFFSLDFLGIDWDTGPGGPADLEQHWSQSLRMGLYQSWLEGLVKKELVFPCACSRRDQRRAAEEARAGGGNWRGGCLGDCRPGDGPRAWRLRTDRCPGAADLPPGLQDCVLWRKDDLPSYQLTCAADDREDGINWIVRGEDLRESSRLQACLLALAGYEQPPILHHGLICAPGGGKLSKSNQGDGGPLFPRPGEVSLSEARSRRQQFLLGFCRWAGWKELGQGPSAVQDLLELPAAGGGVTPRGQTDAEGGPPSRGAVHLH